MCEREKLTDTEITELRKEIDSIQSCITRMSDNSFRLKEWYVSLIAIVITLLIGQECKLLIVGLVLFGITTVFWVQDACFLKTETLYRWKYEGLISQRPKRNLDSLYDQNPHNKKMWL